MLKIRTLGFGRPEVGSRTKDQVEMRNARTEVNWRLPMGRRKILCVAVAIGILSLFLTSQARAQLIQTVAGNGGTGYAGDGSVAASSTLYNPYGVAVDANGNVYIADENNSRIRVVNKETQPITVANVTIQPGNIATVAGNGTPGFNGDGGQATAAEIYNPSGVAVDKAGNIYIADLYNYRVRKVSPSGVISTVSGNGNSFYSGNGPAVSASVFPYSVTVDNAGNIYIADTYNNAIRVVNTGTVGITVANVNIPPGNIATVAGTGVFGSGGDNGRRFRRNSAILMM